MRDVPALSEKECEELFDKLFPSGLDSADILQALAPDGWEASSLRLCFHPTIEQIFEESLHMHRNLARLRRPNNTGPVPPEPTIEEIRAEHREEPIRAREECRDLLGRCLWDIFSNNHEVIAPDGRVCDLGSFRGSGGFIADWLNARLGEGEGAYDYIDFYMGTWCVAGRADLLPVYELIFHRLHEHGCDWRFSFPRLYAIDLQPLRDQLETDSATPEWASYSPSEALAKEQEKQKHDAELAKFRASLDASYQEAVAEARKSPPPRVVRAYHNVFGRFPHGWPP